MAPDAKQRLTGTGRAPAHAFAFDRRGPRPTDDMVISGLTSVATSYKPDPAPENAIVQDFHTFRQALNVASADQRPLVFVSTSDKRLKTTLQPVASHPGIIGRFHFDFANSESDSTWYQNIDGADSSEGIFIIHPGKFGLDGKLITRLPAAAPTEKIRATLTSANKKYALTETRKIYRDHVAQGRSEDIYFEGNVEYGEDRDGDGVIDHRPRR